MMRVPPFSYESEVAVVSIALSDPSAIHRCNLPSDAFYDRRNRAIWEAIERMMASGKRIDHITVAKYLQDAGRLEMVGGIDKLKELNGGDYSKANYVDYCEMIIDAHRCRQEIEILDLGISRAYNGESSAVDVIGMLASLGDWNENETSIGEYGDQFIDECKTGTYGMFPWWSDEWTRKLGKLTSDLVILHAPRSTGKTALMLNWITTAHQRALRTPLASIEMLKKELVPRLISNLGDVSTHTMRSRGCITEREERASRAAMNEIRKLNLCVRDKSMTIDDICTWAIREKSNVVDAIFIDNLLSISDGGRQYQSKTIMYDHFIRRLRDLRDQLGVPIILLAHPNAEGGIAWSKDVENFADIIISLVEVPSDGIRIKSKGVTVMPRYDMDNGRHIMAIFQKNRQGICPVYASLCFNGSRQRFEHMQWEGE